jgi:uncharacterized membrane protein
MSTEVLTKRTGVSIANRDLLRLLSFISIIVGVMISGYLSYAQFTSTEMVCVGGEVFNCGVVQNSVYAKFMGIQIAYLGLATYLILGILLFFENRITLLTDYGPILSFGITLFAFLFSMWLVYVQVALLQALCPWCLAHEVNITILFGLAALRLRRSLAA